MKVSGEYSVAAVTLDEIRAARHRMAGLLHRTPLLSSRTLNAATGMNLHLKAENFQKTGSFKIRGALNKILTLTDSEKGRGVVTASSGNHGQAVAYAASRSGVAATVVMPVDASRSKVEAARSYGAEVVFHGSTSGERKEKALEIAAELGLTFLHSFDDAAVIAGQGTVGLEILEDLPSADAVVVPIGGGGLISGVATAIKESGSRAKVIGVEPESSNAMYVSLRRGARTRINPSTIADGLRTDEPGELTFAITRRYVDDVVLVGDDDIVAAILFMLERMKILVEPSGAVGVAAALTGKLPPGLRDVVVLLSGGNVDLHLLTGLVGRGRSSSMPRH